LRAVTCRNPD